MWWPPSRRSRVVLERRVEVALAVEDRDRDVASDREQRLELDRMADPDGVEAGPPQLGEDGALLGRREGCDDGRSGHGAGSCLDLPATCRRIG